MKKSFAVSALLFLIIFVPRSFAYDPHFITVSKDGTGDFKTITAAVAALPMFNYERVTIFIKNGVYNEKLLIDQDYITLRGESRDSTIISYSQLRTEWITNKDSIGPAVINVNGDDFILENLTVENTQPEIGPHAFTIYGIGTRTIIFNCSVTSNGGDTVSLWNYKEGMYYHAGCYFKGAVDFVCPRGWCFIRDSKFYELKKTAAIWHAGGYLKDQKFVIKNSYFDGVKDFNLGRHHYEAQFYLIGCRFSGEMKDEPIFRVAYEDESRNRPFNWGKRYYYYGCEREGGNFSWFEDNLESAGDSVNPGKITAAWTFGNRWDPESNAGPAILKKEINGDSLLLYFSEPVTVIGKPVIESSSGKHFKYFSGGGSGTLRLVADSKINSGDIESLKIINQSKITGTIASVRERAARLNGR